MLDNIIAAWILVFALVLLIISLLAYKRSENTKILVVSIAFAIFFVKGLVLTLSLFVDWLSQEMLWSFAGLCDIVILLSFYFATLKR